MLQTCRSKLLKMRRSANASEGGILPVEALPRGEDLRTERSDHGHYLRTGIAVDFHADGTGDLHHLRYELLHRRTRKVSGNGGLVGVALDQAATGTIGAEHKVVAQGARLLLADRDHLFHDGLKLGELAFVNIDIDQQAYAFRAHAYLVSLS